MKSSEEQNNATLPVASADAVEVSEFDLFISYARQDIELVRPLVAHLQRDGYKVWFDQSDMPLLGPIADTLEAALDSCGQMLVCLSDSYCKNDYTMFELQLNFSKDPGNKRNRNIPVLIRGPLTEKIPAAVKIIPWADLTNSMKWEVEYRRIVHACVRKRPPAKFASPSEVQALRLLKDPDQALARMKRYAREINSFIYQQEVAGPMPGDTTRLALQLTESSSLPAEVRFHISAIQRYADLIDYRDVKQSAIEPALLALHKLAVWATDTFHVEHAAAGPQDPLAILWGHLASESGNESSVHLPNSAWELAEGRRQLTAVGALYRGHNTEDGTSADLLLLPANREHSQELSDEVEWCKSLGEQAPLNIRLARRFNDAQADEWRLLVLAPVEGCSLEDLGERFRLLPQGVALAISRRIIKSFQTIWQGAPALTHSLFHFQHLVLDRSGVVRISWDWNRQGGEENSNTVKAREDFWFSRMGNDSLQAMMRKSLMCLRDSLCTALDRNVATDLLQKLRATKTIEEVLQTLAPAVPPRAEDQEVVRVAVECWLDHKDLPPWLDKLEEPEPKPVPPVPQPPAEEKI